MNVVAPQPLLIPDYNLKAHYEERAGRNLKVLWRRRRLIAGIVAGSVAAAVVLVLFVLPKTYTAETLLQIDFGGGEAVGPAEVRKEKVATLDAITLVESEARVIKSRAIARRVVERLKLQSNPAFAAQPSLVSRAKDGLLQAIGARSAVAPAAVADLDAELAALGLMERLSVANDTRSYLITIAFSSRDPAQSATIVNAFADEYLRNRVEANVVAAGRTGDWIAGQIAETRVALARAEAKVNAFREETGFVEIGTDGSSATQRAVADLTGQLSQASAARMAEEAKLVRSREAIAAGGLPSAQDLASAPMIQRLRENEVAAQRNLADLFLIGPKHPGLALARATLAESQTRVEAEIQRELANLEGQVRTAAKLEETLTEQLREATASLIASKGREAQLRSLQSEAAALRSRLQMLSSSYEQTTAAAAWRSPAAQVIVPAQPVPLPSGPKPWLILGLAFGGALAVGGATALLLERRDTGFHSEDQVAAHLDARCVGITPRAIAGREEDLRLCQAAVRQIAATLDLGLPGGTQTVLITSSVPREGKSVLALALAVSVARGGRRVLVIDWTPDRGSAAPTGETASRAMSDPQGELRDRMEAVFDAPPGEGPMLLRPTGHNPVEHIYGTPAFEDLLRRARAHFDLIIMEAAPVLLVTDVALLARTADVVLHAVKWNSTRRRTVELAMRRLSDLSVRVRGVVLTKVDLARHAEYQTEDQGSIYRQYRAFYSQTSV